MKSLILADSPHRRFNLLTREWVLVSPHRSDRPWQGQTEPIVAETRLPYDSDCYLCPGNLRANGERNPDYDGTFVFTNDFSALLPPSGAAWSDRSDSSLLVSRHEAGLCRVVCYSPRHDLTLPEMEASAVRAVVDVWAGQYEEIGALPFIHHVQIFENSGEMMGCSNPHPHGQIWANETLPNEPAKESVSQLDYFEGQGRCLLCDYLALEVLCGERLVCENDHFVAVAPFWAVWPFETMVLSRRHVACLTKLTAEERDGLANLLQKLMTRYDNLFSLSFPYSMGFHQKPTDGEKHPEWHLHAHFYPPLLRSATVKKFMVGYEMLCAPQRDLTAEAAAERLRALSERHYRADKD